MTDPSLSSSRLAELVLLKKTALTLPTKENVSLETACSPYCRLTNKTPWFQVTALCPVAKMFMLMRYLLNMQMILNSNSQTSFNSAFNHEGGSGFVLGAGSFSQRLGCRHFIVSCVLICPQAAGTVSYLTCCNECKKRVHIISAITHCSCCS